MKSSWLVSPTFDLLFVANVLWPLALIPTLGDGPTAPLVLWQLYFVTTPHRWITLLLVATDPDRRQGRDRLFIGIAGFFALLIAGIAWFTGGLGCLILLDLLWNAWHFGSQHAGVLRLYSLKSAGGFALLEKHGLRWFIVYVGLRVPASFVEILGSMPAVRDTIQILDGLALTLPVAILLGNIVSASRSLGKWTYLLSVITLYSGLLISLRFDSRWTVAFALASAIFHATEYLAIVTHYAWRREHAGSEGIFRRMARYWVLVLALFVVGWAVAAATLDTAWTEVWLVANLFAAFLHYAYDGLIWKLRKPETATAMGVNR